MFRHIKSAGLTVIIVSGIVLIPYWFYVLLDYAFSRLFDFPCCEINNLIALWVLGITCMIATAICLGLVLSIPIAVYKYLLEEVFPKEN
jgi:hypothetical protein